MIEAHVVCDSINHHNNRLTTMKLVYPKFIHGEFMTHRVFSRNASSSRAIPVAKLIAEVRDDATRAGPVVWAAEQKGMQGGEELSNDITPAHRLSDRAYAIDLWRKGAEAAANVAGAMVKLGVHKSIVNRLLEPFSHIRVVVSATEYNNFFGLRLDKAAQPEMRALAGVMWRAYNESEPKRLQPGEWHLPFVDDADQEETIQSVVDAEWPEGSVDDRVLELCRWVSVARCARVSYESFETGKRSTVEEDLKLYDRLVGSQPLHASPAEHQATPDPDAHWMQIRHHAHPVLVSNNRPQWGNFIGWLQYRKMLPGEACAPLPAHILAGR